MKVAALLLAAGAGTRMAAGPRATTRASSNKLLLEYRGTPMVCHAAETAQTSRCDELFVVLGSPNEELHRVVSGRGIRIVENADWASGLASSLRAGSEAIAAERPAFDALVVLLADQPHVTSAHIDALLDAFGSTPDALVASGYAGIDGVPALFPRRCFDALAQLTGDAGARSLLAAERATSTSRHLIVIPFEPAAMDIDTPGDYAALLRTELPGRNKPVVPQESPR